MNEKYIHLCPSFPIIPDFSGRIIRMNALVIPSSNNLSNDINDKITNIASIYIVVWIKPINQSK